MVGYPLLNLSWTMLWLFLWVMWLFLFFKIVTDIFRSHDLGGWGKAGWLVLVLVLPFVGVLIYLIARGGTMNNRDLQDAETRARYGRRAAGSGTAAGASELAQLADLKRNGDQTQQESDQAKARLLI